MPHRRFLYTSGGPTFVTEVHTLAELETWVDAGQVFDFEDIGGSTFSINPSNVVAVLERDDPQ